MPIIETYRHFGGDVADSANLKNLLAHAGVKDPRTGKPCSEALCYGLAGGIGIGYSWCPSIVRWGTGSGISIVGRYLDYATGAIWYQGFFDRLGLPTRVTETSAINKAQRNLIEELAAGRPTVVWSGQSNLDFLGDPRNRSKSAMHCLVVFGIDEDNDVARCADRAATGVAISLEQLSTARAQVCSHKNRTLTFQATDKLTAAVVKKAIFEALHLTAGELLQGKMKTFSLPGLEQWAKMMTSDKSKDGWLKALPGKVLYLALRDVFDSIQTSSADGGLQRGLYADYLDEAAAYTSRPALADLAKEYRDLHKAWSTLAEESLPNRVKVFQTTKETLVKRSKLFGDKGAKSQPAILDATAKLAALYDELPEFPLDAHETRALLTHLSQRVLDLHARETSAAEKLRKAAG